MQRNAPRSRITPSARPPFARTSRYSYGSQPPSRPERSLLLFPIGFLGFLTTMAITLTMVILARGPDTHAHLAIEADPSYTRTEVQYVPSHTEPAQLPAEAPPVPVVVPGSGATHTPAAPSEASFVRDVLPILKSSCAACHGAGVALKNVNLSSYEAIMAARPQGPLIVTGNPDESLLVSVLRGKPLQMPPGVPLPDVKVLTIEQWIKQGAPNN